MENYIGKRLDGRYAVEKLIGEGGMADVYRGTDLATQTVVAVKVLKEEYRDSEELVRRFMNESRAISVLSHPNIVKVFDVSVTDKVHYIVMEYIRGITLKEYIEQRGEPLTYKEVIHFLGQVLRAIQHAHDKGIIHRDIKPQNIMILEDGTVKVMDFGIARLARSEMHTAEDQAIGSVHYISPEQAQGAGTDHRADIYSVGIMMYEMLSGTLPFEDENAVSVAIKQISDMAVPLRQVNPSVPEGLADIVARAMAKDMRARYQSALEMLRDIEEFKTNPGIKFEYDYLDDEPAKYVDRVVGEAGKLPAAGRAGGKVKKEKTKKRRRKRRMGLLVPITFGVTLALVGACVLYSWDLVQNSPNPLFGTYEDISLPDFQSMQYTEVEEMLKVEPYDHLRQTVQWVWDPNVTAGTVISQNPVSSREDPLVVKENQMLYFTVSRGIESIEMPDITVYTKEEAVQWALDEGLMPYVRTLEDDTVTPGKVVGSEPEVGFPFQKTPGRVVTIYVSGNKRLYDVAVPRLIGLESLDAAQRVLDSSSLLMGKAKEVYDATPAGTIIDQNPQPGGWVTVFESVYLTVSKGPEPAPEPPPVAPPPPAAAVTVALPDLKNRSVTDAQNALAALGLGWNIDVRTHDSAANNVYGQSPEAGTTVPVGSTVTLYVSNGPASSSQTTPPPNPTTSPPPTTTSPPTGGEEPGGGEPGGNPGGGQGG